MAGCCRPLSPDTDIFKYCMHEFDRYFNLSYFSWKAVVFVRIYSLYWDYAGIQVGPPDHASLKAV